MLQSCTVVAANAGIACNSLPKKPVFEFFKLKASNFWMVTFLSFPMALKRKGSRFGCDSCMRLVPRQAPRVTCRRCVQLVCPVSAMPTRHRACGVALAPEGHTPVSTAPCAVAVINIHIYITLRLRGSVPSNDRSGLEKWRSVQCFTPAAPTPHAGPPWVRGRPDR